MGKKTAAKSRASSRGSGASGSGHSDASPANSTSSSSPKCLVGSWQLTGVPEAWDNDSIIRERIRDKYHLLTRTALNGEAENGHVEGTTDNLVLNEVVLLPICQLMKENNLTLPNIDNLCFAISKFYAVTKTEKSLEHAYHQSWAVRRLLVHLKSFTYRDFPPQDNNGWKIMCVFVLYISLFFKIKWAF